MKRMWIIAAALAALAPAAARAQQTGNRPAPAVQAPLFRLPPGAVLVATAEISRLRAFPEQQSGNREGPAEAVVGVRALDRVYQTDRSYADVVGFFDQQAAHHGNTVRARDTTQTSTAWTIVLPQGEVVNAIVRNTRPTTIEIVSAVGVAAEAQPGGTPAD